jgi:DNA-binding NarL/FixJ family response regulator
MGIYMPIINGNEALNIIRCQFPDIKIIVLSMCSDMDLLSDMHDAGLYGIVSKADEPEELVRAITSVSEQRIYRNKLFTELMYWNKQNNIRMYNSSDDVSLSEREKDVLKLLWEEKSNKEIGDQLSLGVRSIEKIRQDIKEKIGVKSTTGLLKYAINKKIIEINCWQPNISQREKVKNPIHLL